MNATTFIQICAAQIIQRLRHPEDKSLKERWRGLAEMIKMPATVLLPSNSNLPGPLVSLPEDVAASHYIYTTGKNAARKKC
jgi:hypothetical protein